MPKIKPSARIPFLLLTALLIFVPQIRAQYQLRNDIPVLHNGDTLAAAWAGGLNAPQFSTIDLNNDGKKDLFLFDRVDYSIHTWENVGTASAPEYEYAPQYVGLFPDTLVDWVLMRDYDGDGYDDLWTATPTSYVRVYHNDAAQNGGVPIFSLQFDPIWSRYPSHLFMYSARADIPGIVDYDNDGDLDFFTFEILGVWMEWHKNIQVDSGWPADTMGFVLQSWCFGHMEELSICSANVNLTPCSPGMRTLQSPSLELRDERHTGSTVLPIDLNGDAIYDYIMGDAGCSRVYAANNNGTTTVANFISVETNYPQANVPVLIDTFVALFHLPIDGDEKRDLIATPNAVEPIQDRNNVWLYHNAGTDAIPDFELVKKNYLVGDMMDAGTGSAPAFFDYNQDGAMDILLANQGFYTGGGGYKPALHLYENTGTGTNPIYELVDTNYLGLSSSPTFSTVEFLTPTVGDLDNDGDDELLLGAGDGTIFYFQNNGGSGTASFAAPVPSFEGIDVGFSASPFLYDLNDDNDLDLVIGNARGRILYYENTGSPTAYAFDSINGTFGQIKINDYSNNSLSLGYARPVVCDYDDDTKDELLVGTVEGKVMIFDEVSLVPTDTFPLLGELHSGFDFGKYSAPTAARIDTSNKYTYLVGGIRGGLRWYGVPPGPVSVDQAQHLPMEIKVYPNPAGSAEQITIYWGAAQQQAAVELISTTGQLVKRQTFTGKSGHMSTAGIDAGVYLVWVRAGAASGVSRIVILK